MNFDEQQQRLLREFRGADLTPDQIADVEEMLADGAPLEDVPRYLLPRMESQDWGWAESFGPQKVSAALARAPKVVEACRKVRQSVFGGDQPPFKSLAEAHTWVEETMRNHHKEVSTDPWMEAVAAPENYVKVASTLYRSSLYLGLAGPPWLWLPMTKEQIANGGEPRLGRTEYHVKGATIVGPARGDEVTYWAAAPDLWALSTAAKEVCDFTMSWTLGQAALHILTGEVPKIPRFRVWERQLRVGGVSHIIELHGALSRRELTALYNKLRERADTKYKKSFTPADLELVQFVEQRRPQHTWPQILVEWHEGHPERKRYATHSGLLRAYQRAAARQALP